MKTSASTLEIEAETTLEQETKRRQIAEAQLHELQESFEQRVTERTEALRNSEQLHRLAFDLAPAGMAYADAADHFTKVNETMCEITGYTEEELVGMTCADLTFPEDLAHHNQLLEEFQSGRAPKYSNEKRYVRKNGSIRWVATSISLVTDSKGTPLHSIRVVRDITERRATTDALRLASSAMEATANAVFITGIEGIIQYVNRAFTNMCGYSSAEAIGQTARLVRSGVHDVAFYKQLWATILAGGIWRGRTVNRHRNGRNYVSEQTITPVKDAQGMITNFISVQQDITLQKQAEDRLRVSEICYRRLFEAAHDGVLLLNPDTCKITDANPFMTTLLGYPRAQLLGKELFEIGLLKDEVASQEMFEKLKTDQQVRYENLPLETTDGRHQEVEVVANVYDEDGHAVIQCNIRDITVRKLAEDILRRNEALFSELIEQAPVGVYVVDAEWRLQQINSVALPTFAAAHPHIGQSFEEIMAIIWPKAVAEQIIARFRHTMETGEPYQVLNFSRQRRDLGVEQSYEWSLQRVTLPAGEYGVVCFFNDITERRQAEENRKRLAVMTASNKKLERSIVKRQAVEDALKSSQQKTNELLETSRLFQEEFRKLSHRLLTAQEEERKRISRELHDVIAQALTGINLRLASLQSNAGSTPDPEELRSKITQTHKLVEQAVETVHRFARDLRPSMLDDLGLIPSLQMYLSGYQQRTNIQARLEADPTVEQLASEERTVLYRIAQEALTNVERHAKATQVHLQIQRSATGRLCMEIQDNGHGFEAGGSPNQRLGMLGMRERVEMIGGTFDVSSKPGGPTVIRVEVP